MAMYKTLAKALENKAECEMLKLTVKDKSLPSELFELERLSELYLEGSHLIELPDLSRLTHLRFLSVKAPAFLGSVEHLFQLPTLKVLKLIETPLAHFTFKLEKKMTPLTHLTMKKCALKKLPLELGELNNLQELFLPENLITELPFTFPGLVKLKRLNLDSNHFEKFPDLIGHMPALAHISIDHNKFNESEKARIQRQFNITPN